MNERELNILTGVISDPEENVYDTSEFKNRLEIERIINIFRLNEEQKIKNPIFAIKNLATFKLVLSNN